MKGMMNGLVAVIALILTVFSFWEYRSSPANTMWLIGVVVFLIATLVFGGMFLSGRVNKNDDVHITE